MGAHDAKFALGDLDPLRQGLQMVAPKSTVLSTHLVTGSDRHAPQMLWRQMLPGVLDRGPGAFGIDAGLVAHRGQLGDAFLQGRIGQIGDPAFDGVV
ncbi:MAG: hypothetical protein ACFB22_02680 [Rhodothalassiaceae bacterium]